MIISRLKIALITILAIGLVGCTSVQGNSNFPVSDTGFPIGFARTSDGAQIYLGMHRDDVEVVMGSFEFEFDQHDSQALNRPFQEMFPYMLYYEGADGGHIIFIIGIFRLYTL